jgi:ATP adenylyltransferase
MKHIWSPWRNIYIQSAKEKCKCIFCEALTRKNDPESLIVHKGKTAFVILNRFPYTSGHVMVVPFVHKPSFEELDVKTRAELMELINISTRVLRSLYHPEGFNIGANLGTAAGAGVIGHVHFHVVPRWVGDSNFMSTVGEVRVLPEELPVTLKRIQEAWKP